MRRRHCELLPQALEILTPSPWKSYTWKIRQLQADLKDLFVHSALAGSPKIYSMRSRCRHFINFFVLMLSEICWLMFIPLRGGWSVYRSLRFAHSEDKGTVATEPTSEQYFLIHHCVLCYGRLACVVATALSTLLQPMLSEDGMCLAGLSTLWLGGVCCLPPRNPICGEAERWTKRFTSRRESVQCRRLW